MYSPASPLNICINVLAHSNRLGSGVLTMAARLPPVRGCTAGLSRDSIQKLTARSSVCRFVQGTSPPPTMALAAHPPRGSPRPPHESKRRNPCGKAASGALNMSRSGVFGHRPRRRTELRPRGRRGQPHPRPAAGARLTG
eukprot:2421160-Prymnesium_polylepis.1